MFTGKKLIPILLSGIICLLGATLALAGNYNESPMLKSLVAEGKLPPVEERVGEEPLVVKPVERIGKYGGVLRWAVESIYPEGPHGPAYIGLSPNFLEVCQDFATGTHDFYGGHEKPVFHLAKYGELSEDKKSYTLYLRKGIKWSDGVPFIAEDIMFWYEDVLLNDELTPAISKDWYVGGKLITIEKINDYTVRFHFSEPEPLFWTRLISAPEVLFNLYQPEHYLKQFHIKYNPEAEELAKKEGYDSWWSMYLAKADILTNADCPTMGPWIRLEKESGPLKWLGVRNPYFWEVDTAGNQLPYIDKVFCEAISQKETLVMREVSGEMDWCPCIDNVGQNLAVYKGNAEKGNYRIVTRTGDAVVPYAYINQTYKEDLVLRTIFRDVRFRKALSVAINREEINQICWFGSATPMQASPLPGSRFCEPDVRTFCTEHDPARANQLLDEMGLDWDKNREFRLRPDGKVLMIIVEYPPFWLDPMPLLKEYWENVGIKVLLKEDSFELWMTRQGENKMQVSMWAFVQASDLAFRLGKTNFNPKELWLGDSFPLWFRWITTEGKSGEEPPEDFKKNVLQKWDKLLASDDEEEITRLGKEIVKFQVEKLYGVGGTGAIKDFAFVSNRIKNYPEVDAVDTWVGMWPYLWQFQWFIEEE